MYACRGRVRGSTQKKQVEAVVNMGLADLLFVDEDISARGGGSSTQVVRGGKVVLVDVFL